MEGKSTVTGTEKVAEQTPVSPRVWRANLDLRASELSGLGSIDGQPSELLGKGVEE